MFLYSNWLNLSINTRHAIAKEFGIPKKGSTHVVDNKIQNDGYLVQDVENALTLTNLQNYLKTDVADLLKLWNELIWRIEHPEETRMEASEFKANFTSESPVIVVKKRGRPKKK